MLSWMSFNFVRQETKLAVMKTVTSVPPPPTIEDVEQTIASVVKSIRRLAETAGGD